MNATPISAPAALALVASAALHLATPAIYGSAQDVAPAFEVAVIRPNTSGADSTTIMPRRGAFTAVNASVMQLMRFAFQIQEFQVARQPSWFNSERFDIEAKAPADVAAERAEAWQRMLQTLLVDRFNLAYHVEARERNVDALVVARSGHTLRAAPRIDCAIPAPGRCGFNARPGEIVGDAVSMDALAARLSRSLNRPVVNRTNLDGLFDLELRWTPESFELRPDVRAPQGDGGPSIFAALQEQLGLRLEPAKAPVDVFVIDRIERPAGN